MADAGDDRDDAVPLTDGDYRALRRATRTYREDLVVRLGGEVGLRPTEMTNVALDDLRTVPVSDREHCFLEVDAENSRDPRHAYVPRAVEHEVRKYARTHDVDANEPVLDVTPRRVQMLVAEVADRLAAERDREALGDVSTRDLRRYYARRLLADETVHPEIVRVVGGWDRLDSLERFLDEPTLRDVATAFERTSLTQAGVEDPARYRRAVEHAGHAVFIADVDGTIEYVNPRFESVTGYTSEEAVGRTPQILSSGAHGDAFYDDLWETILGGEVWEGELRNERSDGEQYRVHQTIAPITDRDGDVVEFVAVQAEIDDVEPGPDVQRQRDTLERLNAVVSRIQPISEALTSASTREEIESAATERLAASDAYDFAWLGESVGERVLARTRAGITPEAVESMVDATGPETPCERVVRTGDLETTQNVLDDDAFAAWRTHAREWGYRSVAVVPVVYQDADYGVLVLGTDRTNAFEERERAILADLGRRIGQAITAVERKKLLLADTVLELTFECPDRHAFFPRASAECAGAFVLEGVAPGEEGTLLYYVTLDAGDPDEVLDVADGSRGVADARLVRDYGDSALLEFVLADHDLGMALGEHGGRIVDMAAEEGTQRLVGEFPPDTDVRSVVDGLRATFPGTELAAKQETERSIRTTAQLREGLSDRLTDKQAAALRAAFYAGYFEWPRGSTAEELADSMNVSSPTFHNHLRLAQQKLLTAVLEDRGESTSTPGPETLD